MRHLAFLPAAACLLAVLTSARPAAAQPADTRGAQLFADRCAPCHGGDGRGAERGPDIVTTPAATRRSAAEIARVIREGIPGGGMPPVALAADDIDVVAAHVRALADQARTPPSWPRVRAASVTAPSSRDWSLPRAAATCTCCATTARWPRWSARKRDRSRRRARADADAHAASRDRSRLARRLGHVQRRRCRQSPHAPAADHAGQRRRLAARLDVRRARRALPSRDAARDRRRDVRHRPERGVRARRPHRTPDLACPPAAHAGRDWRRRLPASTAAWRSTAIACSWSLTMRGCWRCIAATGRSCGSTRMADFRQHYGATSAPLVVGDLVITGISGGDEGARGFVAAHEVATGREVWRFWSVPARGEPGVGDLAGHGHRSSVRRAVAHRVVRRRSRSVALDHRQPVPRLQRRRAPRRQPVVELGGLARSEDRLACAGTSSSRHTTSTTGTRCRPSLPSMPRSMARLAVCSCRPIAMASSTCWIAKRASPCAPPPSAAP